MQLCNNKKKKNSSKISSELPFEHLSLSFHLFGCAAYWSSSDFYSEETQFIMFLLNNSTKLLAIIVQSCLFELFLHPPHHCFLSYNLKLQIWSLFITVRPYYILGSSHWTALLAEIDQQTLSSSVRFKHITESPAAHLNNLAEKKMTTLE